MIRSASHSSYPRIGDAAWDQQLRRTARERDRSVASDADLRAVEDEVASLVVAEQARAFVDIVTDGLVRWSGPFSHLPRGWDGVAFDGLVRWFETGLYDRRPVVTGPVTRREPVVVRDARLALEVGPKSFKAVLPGPVTLARSASIGAGADRSALAQEFAAAGEGATTILSTYFGDLGDLGSEVAHLPGTHLGLDMVHTPGNWPLLAKLPEGRGVHLGLFDARTTRQETAQEVADRIVPYREILMARDVMVGSQCGLELLPRDAAFDKLLQSRYLKERLEREWRWRS